MRLLLDVLINTDERLGDPCVLGTHVSVASIAKMARSVDIITQHYPELEIVQVYDDQGMAFCVRARGKR